MEHVSEELLLRLKKHNLQQYKHTFEDMGYCENLQALLNHKNYQELVSEINFLPGHKKRFEDMMQQIRKEFVDKENIDENILQNQGVLYLDDKKNSIVQQDIEYLKSKL